MTVVHTSICIKQGVSVFYKSSNNVELQNMIHSSNANTAFKFDKSCFDIFLSWSTRTQNSVHQSGLTFLTINSDCWLLLFLMELLLENH
jgi:hypothetical protein